MKTNSKSVKGRSTRIRNIEQLWKVAIEFQMKDANYPIDAMIEIDSRRSPRITDQDIADVVGNVFASHYWSYTKLDSDKLKIDLMSAGIISSNNQNRASEVANRAFRQWRGMFSRNNFADTGLIPKPGNFTNCPDIICSQVYLKPQIIIEQWNNQFWNKPSADAPNYIYIRSQSLNFDYEQIPDVQMFYTHAGFNQPPTSWKKMYTAENQSLKGEMCTVNGELGEPFARNTRGCSEAFVFNPKSDMHVCVIGIINTNFFKDFMKTNGGNWESLTWIRYNGAAVWRNYDPQTSTKEYLKFYNQDNQTEEFTLKAVCENVPVGYTLRLMHNGELLKFDSGKIEILNNHQVIQEKISVPGNYEGDVEVEIVGKDGSLLPADSHVEISFNWSISEGHNNYFDALSLEGRLDKNIQDEDINLSMGSFILYGE